MDGCDQLSVVSGPVVCAALSIAERFNRSLTGQGKQVLAAEPGRQQANAVKSLG